MRTLLLLRHGRADSNVGTADHDRPLHPSGADAARLMGRFISKAVGAPDLILASSAVRAKTTAELAAQAGQWDAPLQVSPKLYESSVDTVLEQASAAGDDVGCQLLVGHQPTWPAIVAHLVGGGEIAMPPAALACVQVQVGSWSGLSEAKGVLAWLVDSELAQRLAGSR